MTDAARSMLDELMGKTRNATDIEKAGMQLHFDADEVCKLALVGLCPYQLFNNTRSDLGPCDKEVHEGHIDFDRVKKEYDNLSQSEKDRLGYELELYHLLRDRVGEMDRKIERQRERVQEDNKPRPIKPADQARLDALKESEKTCIEQSETLALDGDADGSIAMTEAAEKYKVQHDELHHELVTPDRIMSVCEVCGVLINSADSEQRRLDHINGKQYIGWNKMREKLKELEAIVGQHAAPRDGFHGRATSKERERDAAPHYERSRDRYTERGARHGEPHWSGSHWRGDREPERGGGRDRYYDRDRGHDRYGDRYHSRGRYDSRDRGFERRGDRDVRFRSPRLCLRLPCESCRLVRSSCCCSSSAAHTQA